VDLIAAADARRLSRARVFFSLYGFYAEVIAAVAVPSARQVQINRIGRIRIRLVGQIRRIRGEARGKKKISVCVRRDTRSLSHGGPTALDITGHALQFFDWLHQHDLAMAVPVPWQDCRYSGLFPCPGSVTAEQAVWCTTHPNAPPPPPGSVTGIVLRWERENPSFPIGVHMPPPPPPRARRRE